MKGSLVLFIALLALVAHSCKEQPPSAPAPEPQRTLTLSVADTSLHEIWLRIVLPDSLSGRTVKIYRNDTLRFAFELSRRDTVVMDSGLALGTSYAYHAVRLENTRALDSTQLSTATMPTTSHAVVWRIDTLGRTATWLNDVCVINDTCIWVVGQIHAPPQDSLGYWTIYNAARFDGQQWHLYTFQFPLYNGDGTVAGYYNGECTAVFGLSPTSILFSDGGGLMVWNGTQARYLFQPLAVSKIWASSENDIYVVGGNGFIAHYNGTAWRRVQSGTTTIVRDVWGSIDKATGDTLVLAAVSLFSEPGNDRQLLQLRKTEPASQYPWTGASVHTAWFRNHTRLFAAGGGIWHRLPNGSWHNQPGLPTVFRERIRGQAENDVFTAGHFGFLAHYNGVAWQVYPDLAIPDIWDSMDYQGSTVCVVGYLSGRGIVAIGRRGFRKGGRDR